MTGFHLAQVNLARLAAPLDSPRLADFAADLPVIHDLADRSPGFVWRMEEVSAADAAALPEIGEGEGDLLPNCSVWESVEALWEFSYRSDHLRLLSRRREWFVPTPGPYQALWWVPVGHLPSLVEAVERLGVLRDHGPGPQAFTFRNRYPAPDARGPEGGADGLPLAS